MAGYSQRLKSLQKKKWDVLSLHCRVLLQESALLAFSIVVLLSSVFPLAADTLKIGVGDAKLINFDQDVKEIFISDPTVADIQVSSKRAAYIYAKAIGNAKLFVTNSAGKEIYSKEVYVTHNLYDLKALIKAFDPHELVEVTSVPYGLILEGVVDTPLIAQEITALARRFLESAGSGGSAGEQAVLNRLTIKAPVQVNLRVKVAEVSRAVVDQLGFNWQAFFSSGDFKIGAITGRPSLGAGALPTTDVSTLTQATTNIPLANINTIGANFTNSNLNLNAILDMLEQTGLVTILAEPNLVAVSGETASFLAGGEFPYPVPQGGGFAQITIQFKQYGVSLSFTPTVLDGKLISLRVRPEVSELDQSTGVSVLGTEVPGILTRRAETTIQLGSGQSFAIAGLLKNTVKSTISAIPGLGDIPILGALFRSNTFLRGDSELVILVTPYIVDPVSGGELSAPTDGLQYASFIEQIVEGRIVTPQTDKGQAPAFGPGGMRLLGPAGFSVE